MSGTWPTSPGPDQVTLEPRAPILLDIAQSGKSQSRTIASKLWAVQLTYPELKREQIAPIIVFADKQRGDTFQIVLPNFSTPMGVATGTPVADGAQIAGSLSIDIRGMTAATTGILKAGDVIKAANHSKVYMVTEDADTDGSGNVTVQIDTPLTDAVGDGEAITVSNVPFTMRIDGEVQSWRTKSPQLSRYSVELIEAL